MAALYIGSKEMNSKERFMAALNMEEPDHVPFADWIDEDIRLELVKAVGADPDDEADFAVKLGMDAIGWQGSYAMIPVSDETAPDESGRMHYLGRGKIAKMQTGQRSNFPISAMTQFLRMPESLWIATATPGLRFTRESARNPARLLSLGWEHFGRCQYFNQGLIEKMIDDYVDFNIRLVDKLRAIGFDFFFAYDDLAYKSGPLINPKFYHDVFMPRFRKLADAYKLPWAYHSDGDLTLLLEDLLSLGMNAINPIEPPVMDIDKFKADYGDKIAIWGNIDIATTLSSGTIEEVEAR